MLGEFARVKAVGARLVAGVILLGCATSGARAAGLNDFDPAMLRQAVLFGLVTCAFLASA